MLQKKDSFLEQVGLLASFAKLSVGGIVYDCIICMYGIRVEYIHKEGAFNCMYVVMIGWRQRGAAPDRAFKAIKITTDHKGRSSCC